MNFQLEATDGSARAGVLKTVHGNVATPTFMPVATQGSVKSLSPEDVETVGAKIILGNTYHLYLRPGVDLIDRIGGLHTFMGWDGPILTDSGGFQGFSMESLREITPDGITFKSHLDGSLHNFTPESVIEHQRRLGSDIIMPLDVCIALPAKREDAERAVEQTNRWAERSRNAHRSSSQLLFGIVQGGLHSDLREHSAQFLTQMEFPGYSIGGLSVGESKDDMYRLTKDTAQLLPEATPRYLMGVGSPEDLLECVARGIDMFDCVLPTRVARNGALYLPKGRVNIYSGNFRDAKGPIQENCDCYTCTRFSAAYLHHLFRTKELLAYRLATIHNLRFISRLMEQMRDSIMNGLFDTFREAFMTKFVPPNEETRQIQKKKWSASRARDTEIS